MGTHGVAYIPNPDPNAQGWIIEGGATVGADTWGETIDNVSAQVGEGRLTGNVKASLYTGSRSEILAQGYRLVDTVQLPGSFAQAQGAAATYVSAVNLAGVPFNAVPGLFGGANSNTVIYSLSPAIGGPRVTNWRAVGGATPFPF